MNSLRILMTADGRSGVWTYAMTLIRALEPSGAEVLLAVTGPELSPEQKKEADGLHNARVCWKPYAAEWMPDPWRDVTLTGDWLLDLEEHFSPRVVHLCHYCHGSLPWTAPVLISAHGCVLSAWQAVHGEQSPHSWTRYHAEVAAGLRGANLVMAPTHAALDSLEKLYAPIPKLLHGGVSSRFPEFRVIPNGLDGAGYAPAGKLPMVFCAGSGEEEALNFELLDSIAQKLSWPVRASAGVGADALRAQAAIFALPSRYEPFGYEPLKAALSGCALVLSDLAALRESWGDAALYAPADSAEAFGAALETLITDPQLRADMAARARERALDLTPERMADSTLECYQHLLARKVNALEAATL
ncbi:MAG: glycosyltransferase family 4 protein [Chthoniobacteraceae bacterium]